MLVKNENIQEQTKRLRFKTNVQHTSGDINVDSKHGKESKQKGLIIK